MGLFGGSSKSRSTTIVDQLDSRIAQEGENIGLSGQGAQIGDVPVSISAGDALTGAAVGLGSGSPTFGSIAPYKSTLDIAVDASSELGPATAAVFSEFIDLTGNVLAESQAIARDSLSGAFQQSQDAVASVFEQRETDTTTETQQIIKELTPLIGIGLAVWAASVFLKG